MLDDMNRRGTIIMFEASAVRMLLLLAVLSSAVVLVLGPTVAQAQASQASQASRVPAEEAALLDCSDFATQRGAQVLFSPEDDRFKLDRDGDGVVCETQGGGTAEDGTELGAETDGDRDCMDFLSQEAAQDQLRTNPSDPEKLDPENNGVACEIRPADYENPATDSVPVAEARSDADLDCEDFEYQQEAQMVLFRDRSDPNDLDGDGNGIACDILPVLASNAEEIKAAPTASPLLAQKQPLDGRLALVPQLGAVLLVASGVLALLAAWRGPSSAE